LVTLGRAPEDIDVLKRNRDLGATRMTLRLRPAKGGEIPADPRPLCMVPPAASQFLTCGISFAQRSVLEVKQHAKIVFRIISAISSGCSNGTRLAHLPRSRYDSVFPNRMGRAASAV